MRVAAAAGLGTIPLLLLAGCGDRFETVARIEPGVTCVVRAGDDLWVGSRRDGLFRIPGGKGEPVSMGEKSGLTGPQHQVMWIHARGKELLLATGDGLVRFSPEKEKVAGAWGPADGLGHTSIRWVGELNGELWAATIAGASRLLPGGKRWRNYDTRSGFPQNHIYRMLHDGRTLWASSMNGGLTRFGAERWKAVPEVKGIGNKFIYAMAPGAGGLWLGTAGGVNFYSTEKEAWDEEICTDGFTDYCVYALALEGEHLWFGSSHGLGRRNISTGEQVIYTSRDGLPDNEVADLLLEGKTLWVATRTGIARTAL